MNPDTTTPQVKMEALRSRAFGNVAHAGLEGRQRALSPENPLAQEGLMPQQTSQNPPPVAGGAAGQPSDMAAQRLGKDKGEPITIVKALIQRLRGLTKQETQIA